MDFTPHQDSRPTGNVLLVGDGGAYRLAVTETFLDGEEGSARPLQWIRDWDVAGYLRHSAGGVVTLKTTGPEIEA
jgi:hypothetical protein